MNKLVSGLFLMTFGILGHFYSLSGPDLAIVRGMLLIGSVFSIAGSVEVIQELRANRKRQ